MEKRCRAWAAMMSSSWVDAQAEHAKSAVAARLVRPPQRDQNDRCITMASPVNCGVALR